MCPVAVLPCAQSISAPGQAQTVCTGDHYSDGLVNSSTKFNHVVNMLNLSVYNRLYLGISSFSCWTGNFLRFLWCKFDSSLRLHDLGPKKNLFRASRTDLMAAMEAGAKKHADFMSSGLIQRESGKDEPRLSLHIFQEPLRACRQETVLAS